MGARGEEMTPLERLAREYINGRRDRREVGPAHVKSMRGALARFADSFGARQVSKMGPADIDRWMESLGNLSAASRRAHWSIVRVFIAWLQRERHLSSDPMRYTPAPKVPRTVPRALTADEVDRLWRVLPDARARAMVALMLRCGLRRAEVIGLQVGDWDRDAGTLRVLGKGGHERLLPVPSDVHGLLVEYAGAFRWGPLIRTLDGSRGISLTYISKLTTRWMVDAGIKQRAYDGKACHALRHTLASEVVDVEPDLRVVQQILGHQKLTSTQIYLRGVQMPKMRAAMEAAGKPTE